MIRQDDRQRTECGRGRGMAPPALARKAGVSSRGRIRVVEVRQERRYWSSGSLAGLERKAFRARRLRPTAGAGVA